VKVAVLVKQTPDTAELPKVAADDVRSGEVKATMVINPWDEYAAEEAILLADRFDADTVAITMGKTIGLEALRQRWTMGATARLPWSTARAMHGDMWNTAQAWPKPSSSRDRSTWSDRQASVDGKQQAVFVGVACKLGYPCSQTVKIVDIANGRITSSA